MRIRTLKPGFFSSEDLSSISPEAHLLAAGVLCISDDSGFFNANPALIKADVFPLRETSVSIQDMLSELLRVGYVRVGTGEDGRRYGQVVKFTEHQRINRPTPSKIKDLPIKWDASMSARAAISERSLAEGKGREGNQERKGKEKTPSLKPEGSDQLVLGAEFRSAELKLDQALEIVWAYYIAELQRRPTQYSWTEKRKSMGKARLRELLEKSGSLESAIAVMKICVDRLKEDAWHNGANARGKKYRDWEHLFRSVEQLEKWMDDESFAPGAANGRGPHFQRESMERCS
jgi:hypothetical protein